MVVSQGGAVLLPLSLAYMGWLGGLLFLLTFTALSMLTVLLLIQMCSVDGERVDTYPQLAERLWGRRGRLLVEALQLSSLVALAISYTVLTAQALEATARAAACGSAAAAGACDAALRLPAWFGVAGGAQLATALVPNMAAAAWTSSVGVVALVFYQGAAVGLSFAAGVQPGVSHVPLVAADPSFSTVMGLLGAMSTVVFATDNNQNIVYEIAAPLRTPPDARVTMARAVAISVAAGAVMNVLGAVSGFHAYGNSVNPNLLLSITGPAWVIAAANLAFVVANLAMFTLINEPVYSAMESALHRLWHAAKARARVAAAQRRQGQRTVSQSRQWLRAATPGSELLAAADELPPPSPPPLSADLAEEQLPTPAAARDAADSAAAVGAEGALHSNSGRVGVAMRLVLRVLPRLVYLTLVTLIGLCVPFVQDILAVVIAVGTLPLDFILPPLLWLTWRSRYGTAPPGPLALAGLPGLASGLGALAVAMLAAGVYTIIQNSSSYHVFAS